MIPGLSKTDRALLGELVRTDFKLRYQGSVLGYLWALLRPMVLFAILYFVFARVLKLGAGVPHYPVYLLLGIVLWNFFAEATSQSTRSIVARADVIRKIKVPRWIIVLGSTLSAVINLALNLCVVAVFMVVNDVPRLATAFLLPLVAVEIYVLALGLSLILSALYVRFRDVSYIWELLLQATFYVTPIIYPLTLVSNLTLKKAMMLNPMAQTIQDARYAAVTHHATTLYGLADGAWWQVIPFIVVVAILLFGLAFFRRESKYFAENV